METKIETEEPIKHRKASYKSLWCAVASAIVAGLGDWFIGKKQRGCLFFVLLVVLLFCYWPLRIPSNFYALVIISPALLLLNVTSSCLTFLTKRTGENPSAKWWLLLLIPIAGFSGATESRLVMLASGFNVYDIPGGAMSPTIEIGDKIVVDQHYFRNHGPEPGEVVVFRHRGLFLVKRIVALGGSTINSKDGQLIVDGQPLSEPYAVHRAPQSAMNEAQNFAPTKVPTGEIFVVGDDRDESLDSRIRTGEYDYGPVFVSDLVGKPLYRFASKMPSGHDGQAIR